MAAAAAPPSSSAPSLVGTCLKVWSGGDEKTVELLHQRLGACGVKCMHPKNRILVVRGPSSSGKKTLATMLQNYLGQMAVTVRNAKDCAYHAEYSNPTTMIVRDCTTDDGQLNRQLLYKMSVAFSGWIVAFSNSTDWRADDYEHGITFAQLRKISAAAAVPGLANTFARRASMHNLQWGEWLYSGGEEYVAQLWAAAKGR